MKNKDIKVQDVLDFIKIPNNFNELHDLKHVSEAAEVAKELLSNLEMFYFKYVMSFIREKGEVLKYIPESQHSTYLKNTSSGDELTLDELLVHHKHYLVNTKNKTLEECDYSGTRLFEIINVDNKQYLIMFVKSEYHSPFSGYDNVIILSAYATLYTFCIKTNTFVEKITYTIGRHDRKTPAHRLINQYIDISYGRD